MHASTSGTRAKCDDSVSFTLFVVPSSDGCNSKSEMSDSEDSEFKREIEEVKRQSILERSLNVDA